MKSGRRVTHCNFVASGCPDFLNPPFLQCFSILVHIMARARKTISPDPYQKPLMTVLPPSETAPGKLPQFGEPARDEFELEGAYPPAGGQPEAIRDLCEGFSGGERFQCLGG